MKNLLRISGLLFALIVLIAIGCKKDKDPEITLKSLKAGSIELNTDSLTVNIPVNSSLVAVFSTNVDPSTVSASTIKLLNTTNEIAIDLVCSGNTVTISPQSEMSYRSAYSLTMSGVKSDKGKTLNTLTIGFITEANPVTFIIKSLTSGGIDLLVTPQATEVPVDNPLIATFNNRINASTATTDNINILSGAVQLELNISVQDSVITISAVNNLYSGTLTSVIFSNIKSEDTEILPDMTVSFTTEGIGLNTPPQVSDQVMYLPLNSNVVDLTGNATTSYEKLSYTTDRYGQENAAAYFSGATAPGNGDIVELTGDKFITSSSTYSIWFKVNSSDYPQGTNRGMFGLAAERGIFMEMGNDLAWFKCATSHQIDPDPADHYFGTSWSDVNGDGQTGGQVLQDYLGSVPDLLDGKWVQFVMTYDAYSTIKTLYINGQVVRQENLDLDATEWFLKNFMIADKADGTGDPIYGIDPVLALGFYDSRANTATGWAMYGDQENTFVGAMDDFRIWDKALTQSEVQDLYNSEKP